MIYSVIVDISNSQVDRVFDYISEQEYSVGQRVEVDFAHRVTEGYVVEIKDSPDCPPDKLKPILRAKDDFCAISPQLMQLGKYMQYKYNLRFIDILRLFVPSEMRGDRVKALVKRQATLACDKGSVEDILSTIKANAAKQRAVVQYLDEHGATLVEQLNADFGSAAVKSLLDKGIIVVNQIVMRRRPQVLAVKDSYHVPTLTQQQQLVADTVLSDMHGSYLLHGVTGSGKTEVYMTIIEKVVSQGKTCIMLVPEISLTPNVMRLFRDRFGDRVALLHSGLSKGERYDEWMRLKNGEAVIAIGARSAIFAPLDNIGAIIIDEEHDASYISDFNPRYDTKDVAKYRRQQNDCILLLGSATPGLDTYYQAMQGKLKLLEMPQRINKHPLPEVETVDMALETRRGNKGILSQTLKKRLDEVLANGKQAMLFLNRRGYSSFLMCTKCGYVAKCADCDITLTVHREDNELKCHYCGKRYHMLDTCPECHSQSFRQGKIGTQQIVELLKNLYPDVKVLRMDADTTQTKEGHAKILTAFANHEASILVGTQMIAKGHDFPDVTLVGILDGDQSLYYSNYLAAERTFQLLTQVAGRSGRNNDSGRVVLQTYTPQHYCLQLAARQDYKAFYRREINLREASAFPPFSVIVRILYSGESEKDCIEQLTAHYADIVKLKEQDTSAFLYLDKMRCPLKRAEKKYRFQILMKLTNDCAEQTIHKLFAITDNRTMRDVQVFVEQNPQNLS